MSQKKAKKVDKSKTVRDIVVTAGRKVALTKLKGKISHVTSMIEGLEKQRNDLLLEYEELRQSVNRD